MNTTNGKKSKSPAPANGEKGKLIALGGLSLVLVGVLYVQFGGSDDAGSVELTDTASVAADENVAHAASAPPSSDPIADAKVAVVEINERLSEPAEEESIEGNPFSNFWAEPTEAAPVEQVEELQAPTVTLNGTLVGMGDQPVALIDGQLRFVGDSIGGWRITEVASRSITLQAPTEESIEVSMPVINAQIRIPDQPGADS